ncbi:MAG: hypothetical protein KatS3mg131_0461 [Candidatus Tectimicrobiota bacterium]|nr:MAG: hypothetical protein KatS3mg131_0461 [Candidatus Tectomicrobia bacterium]
MRLRHLVSVACGMLLCASLVRAEPKRFTLQLFAPLAPAAGGATPLSGKAASLAEELAAALEVEAVWQPHLPFLPGLKLWQRKHHKFPLLSGFGGKVILEIGLKGYIGIRCPF